MQQNHLEKISEWIEITTHNKKVLIGTFYRPPNSPNDTMAHIENSVGLAVDTNNQDILILGDFNLDILKQLWIVAQC